MPDLRIGDGLQPRRHSAGSPGANSSTQSRVSTCASSRRSRAMTLELTHAARTNPVVSPRLLGEGGLCPFEWQLIVADQRLICRANLHLASGIIEPHRLAG